MNTLVWIAQILIAVAFLMASLLKLVSTKAKLEEKMPWAEDYSAFAVKLIGLAEIFAVFGLILPMALNILPVLTPLAAFALSFLMMMAMRVHARRRESKEIGVNLILMLLALFVAFSRYNALS